MTVDPDLERLLDRKPIRLADPAGSRKTEAVTAANGGASVARSSRVMKRP
jgi:hypothetical protein